MEQSPIKVSTTFSSTFPSFQSFLQPKTKSKAIIKMKAAPPRQAGPSSATSRKRKSAPVKIEEEDTPLHAKKIKTERPESTPSVHRRVVLPPPPQVVLPAPRHGPRRSVPNKGLPKQTVASAVSYSLNLSPPFSTNFPIRRLPLPAPRPRT